MSLSIMAVIFAVLLPQVRTIRNSWDSQAGASETIQNGRVLMEHLHRNLSKAARITSVSDSSTNNGYIEFIDNDANSFRYDVNTVSNCVEFGPVTSLSDLAGPVIQLQFTCYDALDLDTPTTDVNSIRNVKVTTTLANAASLGQDMVFSTQAYIRSNTLPSAGGGLSTVSEPWLEYDTQQGTEPALAPMSGPKYLCAYRGDRDDGWACVLTVNTGNWSIGVGGFLEFDIKSGFTPALGKIDDGNFLCAYQGDRGDGWACILYESSPGSLAEGPELAFDAADCMNPALCKIITQGNDHYFLCAYAASYEVRLVVLKATIVPSVTRQLDVPGSTASFVAALSPMPALAKIDDTHYLCVYQGQSADVHGGAVVLTVDNPASGEVNAGTHFDFNGEAATNLELAKIDDTHYLCTYEISHEGRATVLTVSPTGWTVTKNPGPDLLIGPLSAGTCALSRVDDTNFIFAYPEPSGAGAATVLTINTSDWSISKDTPCTFESSGCLTPTLCQIDLGHYLTAYCGVDADGFGGVLELRDGPLP